MHALLDSTDALRAHYARARESRADIFQEQGLSVTMAAATGRQIDLGDGRRVTIKPDGARVALDAIKWATARMAPKTAPAAKLDVRVGELPDLSRMSDEDLAELNRLLEKTTGEAVADSEAESPTESE
jgi:hypothetical protein